MNDNAIVSIAWKDSDDKARWYDAAAALDARLPLTRELATRFRKATGPNDPEACARNLHQFVRDSIVYIPDPKTFIPEETRDSDVCLQHGFEDCDGKARLYAALLRAAGIEARIRPVFLPSRDFVHVQTGVRWRGSEEQRDRSGLLCAEPGGWLVGEVTVKGVGLGEDPVEYGERDKYGALLYA